jgi:threonine dehydrogenase-like Zn-dependent dehydrogenase
LRPGGIISTVGVCSANDFYFNPAEAYDKNITYKNITYKVGRCPARFYMDKLIPVLQERKVNLDSIITHRMPLDEGRKAYDIFANKKEGCLKIILQPS